MNEYSTNLTLEADHYLLAAYRLILSWSDESDALGETLPGQPDASDSTDRSNGRRSAHDMRTGLVTQGEEA